MRVQSLEQPPAHSECGGLLARELRCRRDADAVDHHHAARDALGEAQRAIEHARARIEIRHDQRGARGDAVDHATVVIAAAAKREAVRESELARADGELARALQHERVHAIRGVGIARVESVMDEEGKAEPVGFERSETERPVLFEALRAPHPVEHVVAVHGRALLER